jgi:hypothetical protein
MFCRYVENYCSCESGDVQARMNREAIADYDRLIALEPPRHGTRRSAVTASWRCTTAGIAARSLLFHEPGLAQRSFTDGSPGLNDAADLERLAVDKHLDEGAEAVEGGGDNTFAKFV